MIKVLERFFPSLDEEGHAATYGLSDVLSSDRAEVRDEIRRVTSILESSPARAVVHWRYAPCETRNYAGSFADPITGWSDWVDEYWTVYPDGIAVRKQVLWSSERAEWGPVKRAIQQRRSRLSAWRRQRGEVPAGNGDRITPWLDKEIERLAHLGDRADEPLMAVKLRPGEVKFPARQRSFE